jgi:hypothetical protein
MARAIALKLQPQSALAVVVRTSGKGIVVEHAAVAPIADGDAPAAIGQRLANALESSGAGRAPTVVALPRTELHWANYDLPPAPPEELPQLVLLQAQRDLVLADDGVGFDFLSLEGNNEHPHRILGVGVTPLQLERIRAVCDAADLKLARLVPEALGWVELSRRVVADGTVATEPGLITVFAAIAGRQAAVWALADRDLKLVRTVWLAAEPTDEDDLAALAGELRRTLLALSHTAGAPVSKLPCVYVGQDSERVAGALAAELNRPVRSAALQDLVTISKESSASDLDGLTHAQLAPLAAIAAAAAADQPSPLDLLHPHRPPAPPSKRRTYILAGAAAACVVLALGWTAYRRIAEPRAAAAAANAERAALEPSLEKMAEIEAQAAAVETWLNESGNLLAELDALSQQLRPQPLADAAFNSGEDLIITKLAVAGRQFTIDGAARTADAVAAIERRLRAGNYSYIRGVVEEGGDATPGYAARISEVVERIGEPPAIIPVSDEAAAAARAAIASTAKSPSGANGSTTGGGEPDSDSAETSDQSNAAGAATTAVPAATAPTATTPSAVGGVEYPAATSAPTATPATSSAQPSYSTPSADGSSYAEPAADPFAAPGGSP